MARRLHQGITVNLLDLTRTANAISARQDYSIRALVRSDDEVGLLVEMFNHMIGQIQLREERLERALERAEQAKRAKAQFLAVMSHEIRTPINGILGMTQLLEDSPLQGEQAEFTKTIQQSASGLLRIINDILEFSKGESKSYSLESIPFSMEAVIKDCLATTSMLAVNKGIELSSFTEGTFPPGLRGDPARLRQVLLNLISNAIKFTPEGSVKVRLKLMQGLDEQVSFAIEVCDTGIGIPADRIDRLYKSFSQVDSSNHRLFGGTGLGLAISKQLVEAMGGSMTLRTEEGVGSSFGFELSLPRVSDSSIQPARIPRGKRILAIESSSSIQDSLAELLNGNDIQFCSTAAAARKLLVASKRSAFDLVILDVQLATDLGLKTPSKENEFPDIPLILITPMDRRISTCTPHWPGSMACLRKPLNPSDLYACIARISEDAELQPANLHAAPSKPKAAKLSRSLRALVVEDHPVNQRITARFLQKLGAECEIAENGKLAVEAFEAGGFDLILMDVQMPIMDGIQATLSIRKLESGSGAHIPIIAMTASVLSEDQVEREEAGFDDFVPKPVQLSELSRCLESWIAAEFRATGHAA